MFDSITDAAAKVEVYIRSGVQAVHIIAGGQQAQVDSMLNEIAKKLGYEYVGWNSADGFFSPFNRKMPFKKPETLNFPKAMDMAVSNIPQDYSPEYDKTNTGSNKTAIEMPMLVAMFDTHYELGGIPAAVSKLKFLITNKRISNKGRTRVLFIVTTGDKINPDVAPYMKIVDMPLPNKQNLEQVFDHVSLSVDESKRCTDPEVRYAILGALTGLTSHDAEDVLAEALIKQKKFCLEMVDIIEEEKATTLKKSEALTYTQKNKIPSSESLGGYSELKEWLRNRKVVYTSEAETLNLDNPKGIVLAGVPGTGKSVCAQIIAREFNLPLIRLDVGAVFNSLVGESERRVREVIRCADAMNGCVLLIDEADKVLGNAHESVGDSGVTRRIFGQILTWLAEKKTKTFVVMTMNRVAGMPPELLRKGRFDELFFVDVPDAEERKSIFKIHMSNRSVDPNNFNKAEWDKILKASENFVGAEIEQSIKDARINSYAKNKKTKGVFDCSTLLEAMSALTPVVQLDAENIQNLRDFGATRARPASGKRASAGAAIASSGRGMSFSDPNVKG